MGLLLNFHWLSVGLSSDFRPTSVQPLDDNSYVSSDDSSVLSDDNFVRSEDSFVSSDVRRHSIQ
jgi:hypothetical protein